MRTRRIAPVLTIVTLLGIVPGGLRVLPAQSFRRGGTELNAMREVEIPADKNYSVVEVQFFHHGQITPDGKNVLVAAQNQDIVPSRVLQLGPGDYCRLAFQTVERQRSYEIFYGGDPPAEGTVPPWTSKDGLLLETRHYRDCNLNSFESVRQAFESSKRIGAGYVENVQHSDNPFSLEVGPFLSRYTGTLRIPSAGTYGFLTSSQDASFLLVDGKVVVDAPGRHRPLYRATRGTRKDVKLAAGPHPFEYYHAASGPEAIMVAAWEVNPPDEKPQPTAIPSEYFNTQKVGEVQAGAVTTREDRLVPDFLVDIAGDVPLPDNDLPLVGVRFMDYSPRAITMKARLRWDFGDGQTSEEANPVHVYLKPGVYPITLSVKRGTRTLAMTNRVYVDRPEIFVKRGKEKEEEAKLHSLDDYLPILDTYDPVKLDAASLRQLVLAYRWKTDTILSPEPPEEEGDGEPAAEAPPPQEVDPKVLAEDAKARREEARQYVEKAVAAGQVAFLDKESAAKGDEDLVRLARLVGPMARSELGDSLLAARIWYGAASRISTGDLRAECAVEAADVAVNDLVNQKAAESMLDVAKKSLAATRGPVPSRLQRVLGDYHAMTGDGKAARDAYHKAHELLGVTRSFVEETAWRGAHARSTEEFLSEGRLDRAAAQIRVWEDEFPLEKLDGYLTLCYARYWAGREQFDQAVAKAEQLQTVNADSPYVDRILLLAAECEVKRGRTDRALATLHSILTDYPGSPLVPKVKDRIAAIESGEGEGASGTSRPTSRGR